MSGPSDLVYLYDGTFDGFLCCVYESVYARELPVEITPEDEAQPTLFVQKQIFTDETRAARVYDSIEKKIGRDAQELVRDVFCSCMDGREVALLRFLRMGYRQGGRVMEQLGHPAVQPLLAARQFLKNEAHFFLEFLRFAEYGSVLVSRIEPKNFVLPYIQPHFCGRLMNEDFLIFDQTHGAALVWQNKRARLLALDALELPPADSREQTFQALWERFYDTIAIRERENPRCRRTHCPKRYWKNMCEMARFTGLPAESGPTAQTPGRPARAPRLR